MDAFLMIRQRGSAPYNRIKKRKKGVGISYTF